jgi:hypothetical protein
MANIFLNHALDLNFDILKKVLSKKLPDNIWFLGTVCGDFSPPTSAWAILTVFVHF